LVSSEYPFVTGRSDFIRSSVQIYLNLVHLFGRIQLCGTNRPEPGTSPEGTGLAEGNGDHKKEPMDSMGSYNFPAV